MDGRFRNGKDGAAVCHHNKVPLAYKHAMVLGVENTGVMLVTKWIDNER